MDRKSVIITAIAEQQKVLLNILESCDNAIHDLLEDEPDQLQHIMSTAMIGLANETPPRIHLYVENIVSAYNNFEFQWNFRMSRDAFEWLHNAFRAYLAGCEKTRISSEKQLLAVSIYII